MNNVFSQWIRDASFADWATNGMAFLSLFFMILVIIGFRKYTSLPRNTPMDNMGTGIWFLTLTKMLRLIWWDLIPDFTGHRWSYYGIDGSSVNWAFDLGIVIGCVFILRGYYMLVERVAPGQYNIFTAVFYPRVIRLWVEIKKDM